MDLALDVVRRAESALSAVGLAGRKQAALVSSLNVAAVALALGALQVGGTIINGEHHQPLRPSPEAIIRAASHVVAPLPHLIPPRVVAIPDAATLFAPPVIEPTTFGGGATGSVTTAPPDAHSTLPAGPVNDGSHPLSANPAAVHATKLAKATIDDARNALLANAGPLALTDSLLDAGSEVSASTGAGTGVSASTAASIGTTTVASVATTATSATGAVSSAVSGVAGAVGSAVGTR